MSRKHRNKHQAGAPLQQSSILSAKGSWIVWVARICLLGSSGVAAYLLWYTLTKKPMAGCGPGSPCDRVLGSAWAYWLGIPVSAPALVAYVALLIFSFLSFGSSSKINLPNCWRGIFFLGAVIIASAIWFTVLQLSVLKSVCKFCTSAHLLGFTGALLLLSKAPFGELKGNALLLNKRQIVLPVLLGLLSFGALAAGQTLAPKKLNVVTIHKGDFYFDLREVPLIGTTDSPHYIVSLFDYT